MSKQPLYFNSFEIHNAENLDQPSDLPRVFPILQSSGVDAATLTVSRGPHHNCGGICSDCGWTGKNALLLRAKHTAPHEATLCAMVEKGLFLPVEPYLRLSYLVFPDCVTEDTDFSYTSHFVAVDLLFSDGSRMSEMALPDQNGHTVTALGQGMSRSLFTREWNFIEVDLSAAAGKVITSVLLCYHKSEGTGDIFSYVDDICLDIRAPRPVTCPADDVLITRGTMNNIDKSRGLMFPAVCVPGGFNFWAPATNTDRFFYDYQRSSLCDFRISHQSSYHLLDHGVLQFMPNIRIANATIESLGEEARRSAFSHEEEIAHAHEYAVIFDEGSPAGSSRVEIAPTDHAAIVRISFPPFAEHRHIIFDSHNTSGLIDAHGTISFSGCSFRAVVDYHYPQLNAGDTQMYVYGEFDCRPEASVVIQEVNRPLGMVSFAPGDDCVTMRMATSYISTEQARRNLIQEIGENDTFENIRDQAKQLWNDLLGVVELPDDATEQQRVTFRSSQYRMYAYPTNYSENIGTCEKPHIVYASPYQSTNLRPVMVEGQLYTTNGFWDTYRTVWTAYSLLTPNRATALLNGIVQHFREVGWIGRWLTPAAADCMCGTSYDVVFADALMRGVSFDVENAWNAAERSAACPMQGVFGRNEGHRAPFVGYTPNGICWTLENAISDAAISRMAERLGKEDEAVYYANRALFYANVFDHERKFFVQRDGEGKFIADTDNFCPMKWDYGYVETNAWGTAFSATHDVRGLANLYGGQAAMLQKLDDLFAAPSLHYRDDGSWQHEMIEAQDIRLGQYQHSNQPSHHICYLYNYLGEPYKTQRLTREVLDRLYVGSPIGQGVYGDEDNGEQSAWYVLSALGFYPMNAGSDEYCITSPLFSCVTLHLPSGDLVIRAENNSRDNVYIQRMEIDGEPYERCYITHDKLISAREIVFYMGDTPSRFGTGRDAAPSSLSRGATLPVPMIDLIELSHIEVIGQCVDNALSLLTDNDSMSEAAFTDGNLSLIYTFDRPVAVKIITLAAAADPAVAPTSLVLEGSADREGDAWQTLLVRSGEAFAYPHMIRPFAIEDPAAYYRYRLTLCRNGGGEACLSEIELLGR